MSFETIEDPETRWHRIRRLQDEIMDAGYIPAGSEGSPDDSDNPDVNSEAAKDTAVVVDLPDVAQYRA